MMHSYSVFADESGKITDPAEKVVVLATVVTSDAQLETVNRRFAALRQHVATLGIDVHSPKFEFHAREIIGNKEAWRKLDDSKRINVAVAILRIAVEVQIPYAILLIDMGKRGANGIAKLQQVIDAELAKSGAALPIRRWESTLQAAVPANSQHGTIGPLGNATGMLFGLTTGVMDQLTLTGKAKVIADREFFEQVGGWQAMFRILSQDWGTLFDRTFDRERPPNYKPQWHLGDDPQEVDSEDSYGVQLADYIAYTTHRLWLNPLDARNRRMAITEYDSIPHLPRYPGFFAAIPEWAAGGPARNSSQTYWRRKHFGIR